MAAAYDITRGDGTGNAYNTGDLVISNGDFKVGLSDKQHIEDTIIAHAGWWKQYPADGVGLTSYLNGGANLQRLARNIKSQLELDGFIVNPLPTVRFNNGNLEINPNAYKL